MLDAVNITQAVSSTNGAAARAAALTPKQAAVDNASTQAAKPVVVQTEEAVTQAVPIEQQPISPRLRPDFVAGAVVTEFVGSNGEVAQQIPTQAALAYLRAGLTAKGENVPSDIEKFVADRPQVESEAASA